MRGQAWWRERARGWLFTADWQRPALGAFLFTTPLAFLIGQEPGDWLDGAWQVSAVLIGLVVALIIFLLQAAGAQSVRTEATYRQLLGSTGLAWPVALALWFVGWVAIVERFASAETSANPYAETLVLAVFLLQLAAFGIVFARIMRLFSPPGVLGAVEQAFTDTLRRTVEAKLQRKLSTALLSAACDNAGVRTGMFAQGAPVRPARAGRIHDVDLRLPARINDLGLATKTHLQLRLDGTVDATSSLAQVRDVPARHLARTIRRGVVLRRRVEQLEGPVELLKDVLDIVRRGASEGSQSQIGDGFELLVYCVGQFPAAYARYGVPYTSGAVSEGLGWSEEDFLLRELRGFSREALRSDSTEVLAELPSLSYQLALSAYRQRAPYLSDQALRLWTHQLWAAHQIPAPSASGYAGHVAELARYVVSHLSHRLEDDDLDFDTRIDAAPYLEQCFRFETEVLRIHAEAGDVDEFRAAWGQFIRWGRHWNPEHDVDDLQLQVQFGPPAGRRKAHADLAQARRLVEVRDSLEELRDWGTFELGAWLAWKFERGELTPQQWTDLAPYVQGAFGSSPELSRALARMQGTGELPFLHEWETAQLSADGTAHTLQSDELGLWWATLLLLHRSNRVTAEPITLGEHADHLGEQLLGRLDAIERRAETWDTFLGGEASERVARLRETLRTLIADAKTQRAKRLATAPLSTDQVAEFVQAQRLGFAKTNRLRALLMLKNALRVEVHPATRRPYGWPTDKWLFAAGETVSLDGLRADGERQAVREQEAIYGFLAGTAPDVASSGSPVDDAVNAVAALRDAGFAPDAVLVPLAWELRSLFGSHPLFSWGNDGDPQRAGAMGVLDGVAVFDVAPEGAGHFVVVDLAATVRVIERRLPGADNSLRCDVRAIDRQRARVLFDYGGWTHYAPHTRQSAIMLVVEERAECDCDIDFRVVAGPRGPTASRRIEVPRRAPHAP